MVRRRTKEDDYLGPSKGLAKIMHRSVMLVLYPISHPVRFLLILLTLYLVPTFMGVKPAEVHLWYWKHIKTSSTEVGTIVSDKTKDIIPELPKIEMPSIKVKSTVEKTASAAKVVDMPIKESRRKMFEKAKSAPVAIDIMQQNTKPSAPSEGESTDNSATLPVIPEAPAVVVSTTEPVPSQMQTEQQNNGSNEKRGQKKPVLRYLDTPEFIAGPVSVLNANELIVNGKQLFLHGIYVDPRSPKGLEARTFIEKTVASRPVNCRIEAYTYQNVPTAVCIIDGINLNNALVENGYSKSVSLK